MESFYGKVEYFTKWINLLLAGKSYFVSLALRKLGHIKIKKISDRPFLEKEVGIS